MGGLFAECRDHLWLMYFVSNRTTVGIVSRMKYFMRTNVIRIVSGIY